MERPKRKASKDAKGKILLQTSMKGVKRQIRERIMYFQSKIYQYEQKKKRLKQLLQQYKDKLEEISSMPY
jgi:F0F1-type ATP synthase membrane subunit b/b'